MSVLGGDLRIAKELIELGVSADGHAPLNDQSESPLCVAIESNQFELADFHHSTWSYHCGLHAVFEPQDPRTSLELAVDRLESLENQPRAAKAVEEARAIVTKLTNSLESDEE